MIVFPSPGCRFGSFKITGLATREARSRIHHSRWSFRASQRSVGRAGTGCRLTPGLYSTPRRPEAEIISEPCSRDILRVASRILAAEHQTHPFLIWHGNSFGRKRVLMRSYTIGALPLSAGGTTTAASSSACTEPTLMRSIGLTIGSSTTTQRQGNSLSQRVSRLITKRPSSSAGQRANIPPYFQNA